MMAQSTEPGADRANGAVDMVELREQIERTRADLGETIEALAAKTDVKARAMDAVRSRTSAIRSRAGAMRWRTRRAMRTGAGQTRGSGQRVKRPMRVTTGAAVGALCGWAVYVLLRRRW